MSILSQLLNDPNLDNFDTRVDNLINQLGALNQTVQIEPLTSDFISSFVENAPTDDLEKLFSSVVVSRDRLERYNIYDEAYRYVPIIKRMLKVYLANILQKNPTTGKCLLIREAADIPSEKKNIELINEAKKFADDCIKKFDLITKLKNKIIPNKLVYGDCFLEVIDINEESKKKESATNISTVTLFESEIRNMNTDLEQMKFKRNGSSATDQLDNMLNKLSKYLVEVEQYVPAVEQQTEKTTDEKTIVYNDIVIKIHKPHNIVVLQTDYGSALGYLEVSKEDIPQNFNLTQSLSTIVGKITTIMGKDMIPQDTITDRLVRYIVKQALEKSGAFVAGAEQSIDDLFRGLDPNILVFIKRLIIEQGLNQKTASYNRIRIRFIPVSRMVHFLIPSAEFEPYGVSFIDPLVFHSKLYILSQLSNVILKLSRAAPVR
jgi:hypothetical protein